MAIQGFSPPPSHSHSHSPYYQLLERGSARLGRVKNPNQYTYLIFEGVFISRYAQDKKESRNHLDLVLSFTRFHTKKKKKVLQVG